MREGTPKMAQSVSEVSSDGPNVVHLGPLLRTLDAFLATWGVPLCMFMHFYKDFVNTCAFLMKIRGKTTKIQQIALKIMNNAQKHRKSV